MLSNRHPLSERSFTTALYRNLSRCTRVLGADTGNRGNLRTTISYPFARSRRLLMRRHQKLAGPTYIGWIEINVDRALLSRLCGDGDLVNEKPDLNSSVPCRTTREIVPARSVLGITSDSPNNQNAGVPNRGGSKAGHRTRRFQNGGLIRVQTQEPVVRRSHTDSHTRMERR